MREAEMTDDVCSFDDLMVTVVAGRPSLQCPVCGPVAVPRRGPTLSDFTNAALEHLADVHRVARPVSPDLLAA